MCIAIAYAAKTHCVQRCKETDHLNGLVVKGATTHRQKLQIKPFVSPSHSILTPGQPALALTLQSQAPGWITTTVSSFKSLVVFCWLLIPLPGIASENAAWGHGQNVPKHQVAISKLCFFHTRKFPDNLTRIS